jgi:probable rRNA maturation factor
MVVNRQRSIPVSVGPLREFCERAIRELEFPRNSITIRLVSDPAMARLNRRFRGKRGPTDVLSFSAAQPKRASRKKRSRPVRFSVPASRDHRTPATGEKRTTPEVYLGDIVIAPETARRNARRFSRRLATELRVLILHGMIHLAGYDHETDDGEMNRMERRLRRRFGLQ